MTSISVIITCYSEGEKVITALNSIFGQTDTAVEILLINDHSRHEATNTICAQLAAQHPQLRYFYLEQNGGLSHARNMGFQHASGEAIIFLDGDDELPANAVALIRKAFYDHPEADFVYGDFLVRNIRTGEHQVSPGEPITTGGKLDISKLMLNYRLLGTSPCKKNLWEKTGGYDQLFSYDNQDMDFWYSAMEKNATGIYIPEVIYTWNREDNGMNVNQKADKMMLLYEKHFGLISQYKANRYIELKIIAIYLRNKDVKGLQESVRKIRKMTGGQVSLAMLLSLLPCFILAMFTRLYHLVK
ncbi:MAG: glycosyltransferase [Bacteroidota bacterium]